MQEELKSDEGGLHSLLRVGSLDNTRGDLLDLQQDRLVQLESGEDSADAKLVEEPVQTLHLCAEAPGQSEKLLGDDTVRFPHAPTPLLSRVQLIILVEDRDHFN